MEEGPLHSHPRYGVHGEHSVAILPGKLRLSSALTLPVVSVQLKSSGGLAKVLRRSLVSHWMSADLERVALLFDCGIFIKGAFGGMMSLQSSEKTRKKTESSVNLCFQEGVILNPHHIGF